MWTYHPDLLARAVPRYTSYPTAAEFTDNVDDGDMAVALDALPPTATMSLYLHIPYCREICWYCGCNTSAANRGARLDAYVARLHEEIDLIAARLGDRGRVTRIAFGGGSPNAMAPAAFIGLVAHIRRAFRCADAALSVELDPRGFDKEWAMAIAGSGVERASLGVQTFDPQLQAAIGRIQPAEQIARMTMLLRDAGVASINYDLMYGLPGQNEEQLTASLETASMMRPDRLAVFGYAHVPAIIPRQRRIDASTLPGAAARFAQAALAHGFLTARGYQPVGFDHFASPGDPLAQAARHGRVRRNFQGFTDDDADIVIGLGASAISQFPDRLLQNDKNMGRWHLAIGAGRFAVARGVRRTAEDRLRARAIEALLCHGAANLADLSAMTDLADRLRPFERRGLLRWRDGWMELDEDALPYRRVIAAMLDAYRGEPMAAFSNAV